jgi:hypothetical protein
MRKPSNEKHIGGSTFHVGDVQVWAEIFYLDSSTNYREYLADVPQPTPLTGDMILLDDASCFPDLEELKHIFGRPCAWLCSLIMQR